MPTFINSGRRFYFFSDRRTLQLHEPPHIHVRSGNGVASFWLAPVRVRDFEGYNRREVSGSRIVIRDR